MVNRGTPLAICPECGADVPRQASVCPDCRSPIAAGQVEAENDLAGAHDTVVDPEVARQLLAAQKRHNEAAEVRRTLPARGGRLAGRGAESQIPGAPGLADPGARAQRRDPPDPFSKVPRGGARDITQQPTHIERTPPLPPSQKRPGGRPAPSSPPSSPPSLPPGPAAGAPGVRLGARVSGSATSVQARAPETGGKPVKGIRTVGLVAVELEDALEGGVGAWGRMDLADKISLLAAFALIATTLFPWVGGHMGILIGAGPAWLFSVAAVALVLVRRHRCEKAAEKLPEDSYGLRGDPAAIRRLNLLQIINGLGAVLFLGVLALGFYLRDGHRIEVSYGWFTAVFFAMGLAYSGIARFARDARMSRAPAPPTAR